MHKWIARSFAWVAVSMLGASALASTSFICQEPGGKRLVAVDGGDVRFVDQGPALQIDQFHFICDKDGKRMFFVDDANVRPGDETTGVKIATFDGNDICHGDRGKVFINYKHPDLCPTSQDNRIYSIEGDEISREQLVAGLYLLKPEWFKLSDAEAAEQKKAAAEANAEEEKRAAADQVAGKWQVLNEYGIMEHLDKGTITVAPKKGDAYPVELDYSAGGGPQWQGVGFYSAEGGDKQFWVAYGTPKTMAMCVYDINGGKLSGKWYPWYIDGDAKNVGTENLSGPDTLDGEYKIDSGAAATSAAAYTGTVTIKPANIVGTADQAAPYNVTWKIGGAEIKGIGIKSGKHLFVAMGTGADVNIAWYRLDNGSMAADWFKLGSTEKGTTASMQMNAN